MNDRPDIELNRRRLLGLAGLGAAGVLTWDVARAAGEVEVAGPETRPEASDGAIEAYVRGCTDFGVDLLTELSGADPDRNVMLSPLGLSSALAMTWAGARGETERRMADTLHFPHGQDRLHPAIGALQYDLELTDPLKALGMRTAFDGRDANFRGMTDPPGAADGLHLDWVFHDTHVAVDEEGTVAVAVSAVGGERISGPPSITLDWPFLFCIRDRVTDAVRFLCRVVDPSGK